ncbi:hypothetical protein Pcinc_005152 [Petrolisthes cinctipes]|uniref:Uncharacterized protein n=1 Tax=Petrolisthes cinctipes TaxID=88211 RepID=A0AAE1GFS7_PETCI|nr:hypothetical protein Pcinc_005152 [Petrolisthes cinctipes]
MSSKGAVPANSNIRRSSTCWSFSHSTTHPCHKQRSVCKDLTQRLSIRAGKGLEWGNNSLRYHANRPQGQHSHICDGWNQGSTQGRGEIHGRVCRPDGAGPYPTGVKSILDIGRTLEYLETQGVCVTVLGDSTKFPDFFTSDSGYDTPSCVESTAEVAAMMVKRAELGLDSGMLVAVPIPQQYQAEGLVISQAIVTEIEFNNVLCHAKHVGGCIPCGKQLKETAVKEAVSSVRGRDVTPYILQRVSEITQGQSLEANIALIENNANVGARIAAEYVEMQLPSRSFVILFNNAPGQNKFVIGRNKAEKVKFLAPNITSLLKPLDQEVI